MKSRGQNNAFNDKRIIIGEIKINSLIIPITTQIMEIIITFSISTIITITIIIVLIKV